MLAAVSAVAAVILIALLVAAWPTDRHPSPAVVAAPTSTPGSPTTPPADTPTTPAPTDAAGTLAALRASIDAGIAAGDIDTTAAQQLQKALQNLGKRSGHGKSDQLGKRGGQLLDTINELAEQGHLTPSRADQLRAALQPIAAKGDDQ